MGTIRLSSSNAKLQKPAVYLAKLLEKKHGIVLSPEKVQSLLNKRCAQIVDSSLKGKGTKIGNVVIRLSKRNAEDVETNRRKYHVMPIYSGTIMYAITLAFKDYFRGYYQLNMSARVAKKVRELVDQNPDFNIRLRGNLEEVL